MKWKNKQFVAVRQTSGRQQLAIKITLTTVVTILYPARRPWRLGVANEIAIKHDPSNHLLQYAMASNISGMIGFAVAAGVLISFLGYIF
ncbi:MAG: sodium ion-translocating decarboxylase subunit beta [Imperialibacter sp.]|uniref:sodium ion-translocating decarboxylase subunit beta n=1 Tax=Imperialibacter sp. TaxID=2038411 RepID=UPI0032EF560E